MRRFVLAGLCTFILHSSAFAATLFTGADGGPACMDTGAAFAACSGVFPHGISSTVTVEAAAAAEFGSLGVFVEAQRHVVDAGVIFGTATSSAIYSDFWMFGGASGTGFVGITIKLVGWLELSGDFDFPDLNFAFGSSSLSVNGGSGGCGVSHTLQGVTPILGNVRVQVNETCSFMTPVDYDAGMGLLQDAIASVQLHQGVNTIGGGGSSRGLADFFDTAFLSEVEFFDQNLTRLDDVRIISESGALYPAQPPTVIPEPGTAILLLTGLAALGWMARRQP